MLPIGAFVNAAAIVAGGGIGIGLGRRLPEKIRAGVFQGLGLAVLALGIRLSLNSTKPIIVIVSILAGVVVGSALCLDDFVASASNRLKKHLRSNNPLFTDGFVLAVSIFCLGSLALLGPIQEGVTGDRTLLYTKAILDGVTAMALCSVYGVGVICAVFPLLIYECILTIFANSLQTSITPFAMNELTATGGVIVMGIAVNLLELKRIPLPNLLPALFFAVGIALCIGG
ncbi:DUF554 domain-containing protein [Desulfovibrio inopinatus]|uniref:DUF554 domain-containing protein n=1 Tax=Desulfovibrio inopinatus TaxID=102109 RepID=UPI000410BCBE|nr:DUF554 domain-containing protein [Desulfovibrio inopinatus]